MTIKITVAELNETQAAWMALSPDAPATEQEKVFAAMKRMPKSYLSMDRETGLVTAMFQGSPMNQPMPLVDVLAFHGSHMDRTDIAWSAPAWVAL